MDWILTIYVLFMPLAFLLGGCACCVSPCTYCATDAADQVQLVISGVADASCTDCTGWNNTYILDRYTLGGDFCYWEVAASDGCGWTVVALNIDDIIGVYATVFHPSGTPRAMGWRSKLAGYDDCGGWSSFNLPYVAPTFPAQTLCSANSSTALLTAL